MSRPAEAGNGDCISRLIPLVWPHRHESVFTPAVSSVSLLAVIKHTAYLPACLPAAPPPDDPLRFYVMCGRHEKLRARLANPLLRQEQLF